MTSSKRNLLSAPLMFKLASWLAEHHATINGKTAAEAIRIVETGVGFPITRANLNTGREAAGVDFYLLGERKHKPKLAGEVAPEVRLLAVELIRLFKFTADDFGSMIAPTDELYLLAGVERPQDEGRDDE